MHAHRRSEVHHPLCIGLEFGCRQQRFRQRPHPALIGGEGSAARDGKASCEHPPDVAIEDRRPATKGEDADRRRRRATDSGQARSELRVAGEAAAVVADDGLRAQVQVARTGVVAEAGPRFEDARQWRRSERRERRKAGEEALIVGNHGAHLCLLQHDLGQPDVVGLAALLPRQVVAPLGFLPGDHLCGKPGADGGHGAHRRQPRLCRAAIRRCATASRCAPGKNSQRTA